MSSQDIANIANVLLAVATGVLAWVTYRVAKVSRDALVLQIQPALAFQRLHVALGQVRDISSKEFPPALRLGLVLCNPGKVRVEYRVERFVASLNGIELKHQGFLSSGAQIYPEQESTFFYPYVALGSKPFAGSEGTVEATLQFWSKPDEKHTLVLKYKYFLTKVDNELHWEWIAIEEPKYDS